MDKQMVTGHNPQADAQKTASTKGTDGEKGQAGSEALSLQNNGDIMLTNSGWIGNVNGNIIPLKGANKESNSIFVKSKISGFKMARLV